MSSGYTIGPDADEDVWLWRENGDYPVAVLAQRELRYDPAVWEALVAWVAGGAA